MKKIIALTVGAFLFTGCVQSVQPDKKVPLKQISKFNVIKKTDKIAVVADYNYGLKNPNKLLNLIKKSLKKAHLNIVPSVKNADVVINIDNFFAYRKDTNEELKYNKETYKKTIVQRDSKGNETGGYDVMVSKKFKTSSATLITTVSVYSKKDLEPLIYFSLISTDSDKKPLNASTLNKDEFLKELSQNIIDRFLDSLVTKTKKVAVFLPKNAPVNLTASLMQNRTDAVIKQAKTLLPTLDINKLDMSLYDPGVKNSRNLENDLAIYYLYAMALEARYADKAMLNKIYNIYYQILTLTKDENLIRACANSLARVEVKLQRL